MICVPLRLNGSLGDPRAFSRTESFEFLPILYSIEQQSTDKMNERKKKQEGREGEAVEEREEEIKMRRLLATRRLKHPPNRPLSIG